MPIYQVDGQPIHVVKTGSNHRQTAILIHGWSSSWYAMYPLLELLHDRYRCLAIDLPGYGNSPPFAHGRATINSYADLVAELIRQVSDGPVVLVGHSMGGMISLTVARYYPELVERMVLLCPTITGRLSRFINAFISPITLMERFGLGGYIVSAVEHAFVGLTDTLMRPASFAERSRLREDVYHRLRADARRRGQGRTRAECFWAMRQHDLQNELKYIDTPALVIWGAEDNTVPLSDASIIEDEWLEADLRILARAGHWPHFERPFVTNRIISAYLGLARFGREWRNPMGDELAVVDVPAVAYFLSSSDVGIGLNQAQRTRLAAQFRQQVHRPGEPIVQTAEPGRELILIMRGSVGVWRNLESNEPSLDEAQSLADLSDRIESGLMRQVAILRPGQITGELSMLDQQQRSADLIAGEEGAVVLTLDRNRLLALCEDDAVLGTRVLWNIGRAMAKRLRFILWQLYYAPVQDLEESSWESGAPTERSTDNIYTLSDEE
jgi:pimeloyl-ACP methyl ester carboxylesterase/CRP-like cAMP-binding protein